MGNSNLVNYTKISPNKNIGRNHKIDTITIHHMAGNLSVEKCGDVFAPSSRKASSNYGIGTDGRIGMYVAESDRSWASANGANDNRAVTIEVANDGGAPDWHVSDKAIESLIKLCADICKRNDIPKMLWKNDKSLIGQTDKQNVTIHQWFAATACPGEYLKSKISYVCDEVNKILEGNTKPQVTPIAPQPVVQNKKTVSEIAKEVIAGKWGNGDDRKNKLTNAGYNYSEVQSEVNAILTGKKVTPKPVTPAPQPKPQVQNNKKSVDELAREVIAGKWGNGTTRKKKLTDAGYDYNAVQKRVNQLL